jgi:hypothetical protein
LVAEEGHPDGDERAEASTQSEVNVGDVGIEGEGLDSGFVEAGDKAVIESTDIETNGGFVRDLVDVSGTESKLNKGRRTLTLNPHVSSTPPLMEISKASWGWNITPA